MAAFELNRNEPAAVAAETASVLDSAKLREECIIAHKVYDSCRSQDCLEERELGPARAAESVCIGDHPINEGDIISPPDNAATVSIDQLRIKRIIVVEKEPNPFKNGFWDIDVKFVFEYRLTFREVDGERLGSVKANNVFNKKVTLFGSVGSDLVIATDLLCPRRETTMLEAEPFILVEAKAVALSARLRHCGRRRHHGGDHLGANAVDVTIGLFSIIKLFRIVNLTVESRGFCIPEECPEISPLNPCEFFDNLDFPMDIFAPPQKTEFLAGVSNNIPRQKSDPCDCD